MYTYRVMRISDYEKMIGLWQSMPGLVLSDADSRDSIERYLSRNEGLSLVCVNQDEIVGTVLCGHDGRRGCLYHVAVHEAHRGKGIAKRLLQQCLDQLRAEGIEKCHLMVLENNEIGNRFWSRMGWQQRGDIILYSRGT